MARKLLRQRTGESLVELAVSIAVLSLIVLWAMSAFGAYAKTGQDLDMVGGAFSSADSVMESLRTDSLTQLNAVLPASGATSSFVEFNPISNYQYKLARSVDKVSGNFTLIEVTLTVFDKANGTSVYVVKNSFLRSGEQNVGN
jgi:type II secretory pathway pseudopilin PulG